MASLTAPSPRLLLPMRGALAFAAGLLALFVANVLTGFGPDRLLDVWTSDAIGVAVVVACLLRAALRGEDRVVWATIALGIALWTSGAAYWDHILSDDATPPLPSLADALFVAFYPCAYVAVVALVRRRGRHFGIGLWFDGVIAATACAAGGVELVLEPIARTSVYDSLLATATNFAYPIGDLTLLAMLVVPLALLGVRVPRDMLLLAAGLAAFAVADSIYLVQTAHGTYVIGGLLDAGWLAGMLLIGAGALCASTPPTRPARRGRGSAAVPGLAGVGALSVLTMQVFSDINLISLVLALATLLLVIVRMTASLRETQAVLAARARDAVTDGLTQMPNRRALIDGLDLAAREATDERQLLLVLFDLDGFKVYNDTFGHQAGDALLTRIGAALRGAVGDRGGAYRMGGDEFCAIVHAPEGASSERISAELAAAMGQHGEGFSVTASYGCALIPRHGREPTALLRRADDEMYERKGSRRAGAERQVHDALRAALRERDPELESHADGVAGLAAALGRSLAIGATELRTLVHAAALHDVGKIAIPDAILHKPGPLDSDERRFVRTHPLIAQRIISAAPALGYAGQLVRCTQERWDGRGYPDGLRGEEIPLSARIIAVCSSYLAMTSERPYQRALDEQSAIAELRACAGTQFDPQLVDALIEILLHPERHETREGTRLASDVDAVRS
jgi:two-component system, cell cycle response regulator